MVFFNERHLLFVSESEGGDIKLILGNMFGVVGELLLQLSNLYLLL
jgi:hypothetical protein